VTIEANLPVRVARDRRKADDWSLVLTAADIEHDVAPAGRDWVVLVGDDDLARALAALDAYDQEQRAAFTETAAADYGPTYAGWVASGVLLLFYIWVEYIADANVWHDAGRAYAPRIVRGEWWRAITALTLHANLGHVVSNAVAGAVFGGTLCRVVGPGTGLWVMLLAGGVGNLVNAYLRAGPHAAIGASTAVFAAFGALAGLQSARRYRFVPSRSKAWVPLGAAVAMLAVLGASQETDVWAHLFGLAAGFVAGVAVAYAHRLPGPTAERALVAAAIAAVAGSWLLALS
jgi:membrane associated rhomboid family serine protease